MNNHPRTASLLIALLLVLSADLSAEVVEPTLDKIARTGEIVLGYRTDSTPLSFQDADGQPAGYSVDLCRKIAGRVKEHFAGKDIDAKFVAIPTDERISAVVDGRIDIECGSTTITLSRQERVDFSLPTFVTGGSLLSLASTGIRGMTDLGGKKVGVIKDTTTVEQLRNHLAENAIEAEVVVVANRSEGMQQLNEGSVHAFASDQIVLIGQVIQSHEPTRYSLMAEIFSYEPYGLVVRRNDADFRLLVNRAISELYRDGEHIDIFYKWIGRLGIKVPSVVAAMYQLSALPE